MDRLKTYGEWSPTAYDAKGLAVPDRHAWIVAPVIRTRDASPIEESNFAATLGILGGESESVEVHSFNHWGCGWFDIILVAPDRLAEVQRIADRLADYPMLDEDDCIAREWEAAESVWTRCYSPSERIRFIREHRHGFGFASLAEILECARGRAFYGCPSDILA